MRACIYVCVLECTHTHLIFAYRIVAYFMNAVNMRGKRYGNELLPFLATCVCTKCETCCVSKFTERMCLCVCVSMHLPYVDYLFVFVTNQLYIFYLICHFAYVFINNYVHCLMCDCAYIYIPAYKRHCPFRL